MSETTRRLWGAEIRRLEEINTCPFPTAEKTRAGEGVCMYNVYECVCV